MSRERYIVMHLSGFWERFAHWSIDNPNNAIDKQQIVKHLKKIKDEIDDSTLTKQLEKILTAVEQQQVTLDNLDALKKEYSGILHTLLTS